MTLNTTATMFAAIFLLFALAVGSEMHAQFIPVGAGSVFTVNSSADSVDATPGDFVCADAVGRCTLRAAIDESNAAAPRDAIIFDLPHPAIIDLTLGELLITRPLEIVGPGARRLTVQRSAAPGTASFRIFHVPADVTLNIRGITIRNGDADGGGGIFIETNGTLGLFDSAVSGNRATLGGGIVSFGKLTILRSLINANSTDNQGGGISTYTPASDTTIVASTITGNRASIAGGIQNDGNMLLVNVTISDNTATGNISSILNIGTAKVLNTIIGRDLGQPGLAIFGPFQSLGNNIVTDSRGDTGFVNGVNGDQVSASNAIDPRLGPLADNGGQTDTMALLGGSPAIDRGNQCVFNGFCPQLPFGVFIRAHLDQRRYFRAAFSGGQIDVGAFEADAPLVSSNGSVGFLALSSPGRYLNSPVIVINPTTLERRYSTYRLNGFTFPFRSTFGEPRPDAYVIEIKAKRRGIVTPQVVDFGSF